MRRPFGKPAFQIVSENNQQRLKLTGYPTPEYTLCSAYQLDKKFQIVKIDTPLNRLACWIQMSFTDYSAFFTYVAFKIRQHPDLLKKLYFAGSPEKNSNKDTKANAMKTTADSSQKAELNKPVGPDKPLAQKSKPAKANFLPAPDHLTTLIIKQLAQTVKDNNAHFILLTSANHSPFQMNQQRLLKEGIEIINVAPIYNKNDPDNPYIFKNDTHWSKSGHQAFAEKLAPELIKRITP